MRNSVDAERATKPLVVIAGVSGSGKSTLGPLVARELGVPFIEGDALHSPENTAAMASGIPLDDRDREPWLRRIGQALADAEPTGAVVACSALRRRYRDAIRRIAPTTRFVMLTASADTIAERLRRRAGHFMPASLLASQLATLEPLGLDEPGTTVVADGAEVATARAIATSVRQGLP